MKIRSLMSRNVTCVGPTDSLKQAYKLMQEGEIRHLPVVIENNRLIGMLSDRDILLRADFDNDSMIIPEIDVATAMTSDVVTCRSSSHMNDVAETMLHHKIDAIPVTDELGELVGIITSADFVEFATRRRQVDLADHRSLPFNFTIHRFRPEARPSLID